MWYGFGYIDQWVNTFKAERTFVTLHLMFPKLQNLFYSIKEWKKIWVSPLSLLSPLLSYVHQSWTVSKQHGIKLRCYLECFRGTLGEPVGNLMEIHWEQENKSTSSPHWPPPNPKREKICLPKCMLSLRIGCMKFLFSKIVYHHFQHGLMPLRKSAGTYLVIKRLCTPTTVEDMNFKH